jgi:hypothetical protein
VPFFDILRLHTNSGRFYHLYLSTPSLNIELSPHRIPTNKHRMSTLNPSNRRNPAPLSEIHNSGSRNPTRRSDPAAQADDEGSLTYNRLVVRCNEALVEVGSLWKHEPERAIALQIVLQDALAIAKAGDGGGNVPPPKRIKDELQAILFKVHEQFESLSEDEDEKDYGGATDAGSDVKDTGAPTQIRELEKRREKFITINDEHVKEGLKLYDHAIERAKRPRNVQEAHKIVRNTDTRVTELIHRYRSPFENPTPRLSPESSAVNPTPFVVQGRNTGREFDVSSSIKQELSCKEMTA